MDVDQQIVFVEGAISADQVAEVLREFESATDVGAHDIFLGRVRADLINGKTVKGIEYSAYTEMAEKEFRDIRNEATEEYELSGLAIYHSIGGVAAGQLCLLVIASSPHRKVVFEALQFTVEAIKKRVPVFGKEIFEDESYQWKVNN